MDNELLLQNISDMMDEKLKGEFEGKLENTFERRLGEVFENKFGEVLDQKLNEKLAIANMFKEIDKELQDIWKKVADTFELAQDAWGVSTENRNWLQGMQESRAKRKTTE